MDRRQNEAEEAEVDEEADAGEVVDEAVAQEEEVRRGLRDPGRACLVCLLLTHLGECIDGSVPAAI
jgi:hypothetical protein